ncbi:MAG TPA: c-type cytochrome [Cyclobacteriaceae bacterium]|nr:c-type cytochrome [Cyclobacteriaceae bacterium]
MRILNYLGYLVIVFVVAIGALLAYVNFALPNVPDPENLTIEYTPERIERGRYLANAVTVCMDCHSKRDWGKFSMPLTEGTLGMGGDRFDQSMGMPGVFYARNITPKGISRYTDGELYRVITMGVTKEGRAIFPLMPYPYYGRMDKEDIYSIIAYVRTLAPLDNEVPDSQADFPMNFILNTIPSPADPQPRPDKNDVLAYGAYLTNASACMECHTNVDKGQIIPELAFSGGREFNFPDGSVLRSSNITPHDTGIGAMTEEAFIARFKMYADSSYVAPDVAKGEFNTIMPWMMYGQMTREDLSAIYAYLRTVQPIENKVTKFSSPGAGD